jgi:hypothetical protein
LTQRGISIGQDIAAALNKPSQLGGITSSSDAGQIAASVGLDDTKDDGKGIPAEGAGNDAECDITDASGPVEIICAENGDTNDPNTSVSGIDNQTVTIETDEDGAEVTTINGTDIGTL